MTQTELTALAIEKGWRMETVNGTRHYFNKNGMDFTKAEMLLQNWSTITTTEKKGNGTIIYEKHTTPELPYAKLINDFQKPEGYQFDKSIIDNIAEYNIVKDDILPAKQTGKDTSILWSLFHDDWEKDFWADMLQNPHNKPGTAIIEIGTQGTGKGTKNDVLARRILRPETFLYTTDDPLDRNFNGQLKGKLLVNIDEGGWSIDRKTAGKFKGFITQSKINIEEKFKNQIIMDCHTRVIMTTNSSWAMKLDNDDRRYAIYEANDKRDDDFWKAVYTAIDDDDIIQQFKYELMTRKITNYLKIAPRSYLKDEQIELSRYGFDAWLFEQIMDCEEGFNPDGWDYFPEDKTTTIIVGIQNFVNQYNLSTKSDYISLRSAGLKAKRALVSSKWIVDITNDSKTRTRRLKFTTKTTKSTKTTNFQSDKENLFLGNKKDDAFVDFVADNDNTNPDLKNKMLPITINDNTKPAASFHLIASKKVCNSKNNYYPDIKKINDIESFKEAVQTDHCACIMKNGKRARENAEYTDILMVDIDNSNGQNYTIDDFQNEFSEYEYYIATSKSHQKEKGDKITDRFHIYFPLGTILKDMEDRDYLQKAIALLCKNDGDSNDRARYFNGAPDNCQYWYNPGISILPRARKEALIIKRKKEENDMIDKWISAINKEYKPSNKFENPSLETLATRNINQAAKKLINNSFSDGEKHSELWAAITSLKSCGRDIEEVKGLVKATGIKDWNGMVNYCYKYTG